MPSDARQAELVDFAAPIGLRVRVVTVLVFVIIGVMALLPMLIEGITGRQISMRFEWLGPAIAMPIVGVALVLSLVRRYRLVGAELQVFRLGRMNRFPLRNLTEVQLDRDAMSHAWKKWGNDGLGAITGRFHSKALGNFDALLTDSTRAVVLRWPDRTLVVSPDRETYFVELVRERANLR